jgi:hypothetical protein
MLKAVSHVTSPNKKHMSTLEEEAREEEQKKEASYQRIRSGTAVFSDNFTSPNYPIRTEVYDPTSGERIPGPGDIDPVSSALLEQKRKMEQGKAVANYLSKIDGLDIQTDNIVAAARSIQNQFDSLIYQAKHDPALAEIWETRVREIQDQHRKRGRNWQIERQLLSNVLDYFK